MDPSHMKANLEAAAELYFRYKRGEETAHFGRMHYDLNNLYAKYEVHCASKHTSARRVLGADIDNLYQKVIVERATGHKAPIDVAKKPRRGAMTGEDDALVRDVYKAQRSQYRQEKQAPTKGDRRRNQTAIREARATNPNAYKYIG